MKKQPSAFRNNLYYLCKPLIPRFVQLYIRRAVVHRLRQKYNDIWPIDEKTGAWPDGFTGWPDGRQFALVLNHDVDTQSGQEKCRELMELEEGLGFRSTFYFVPQKRYTPDLNLHREIRSKEFEVGVHGLNHDGNLFKSYEIFYKKAIKINGYLAAWNTRGFSSPSMHHNISWMELMDIDYATSTFDTDPFEPQPDPIGTIFPLKIFNITGKKWYVELPYTLGQDHLVFSIMKEKTIDLWTRKLDWIAQKGGMVLLNTHPDYMCFTGKRPPFEEYPSDRYASFLKYIKDRYEGKYWHVLAKDVAAFWSKNAAPRSPNGE